MFPAGANPGADDRICSNVPRITAPSCTKFLSTRNVLPSMPRIPRNSSCVALSTISLSPKATTAAGIDCRYWRFDGKSGKGGLLKSDKGTFHATDLAVGYDGLLYFQTGKSFSGPLERYTRELKPAPYPSGTHVLSKYIYGRYGIGNCEKGIGVGPDGKVYMAWMFVGWVKYAVSAWGPDGRRL